MRVLAIAAAVSLALLAACDNQTEPSDPPTTQDALTTATATPAPTPDDVDVTTEAAPTTAEPTTEEPVADDGPPEMPEEAEEQTEAGAEAFALHYVNLLNYTAENPEPSLLAELATSECGSCGQFADTVDRLAADDEKYTSGLAEYLDSTAIYSGDTAIVLVDVNQPELSVIDSTGEIVRSFPAESDVTMEFELIWANGGWLIDKIFLLEQ